VPSISAWEWGPSVTTSSSEVVPSSFSTVIVVVVASSSHFLDVMYLIEGEGGVGGGVGHNWGSKRSERKEGVRFCGGSGRASERAKLASERANRARAKKAFAPTAE
jgi:hypothetical protein